MALVVLFVSLVYVLFSLLCSSSSPRFDVYLRRAGHVNIRRKEFLSAYAYEVPDEMSSQGSLAHLFRAFLMQGSSTQAKSMIGKQGGKQTITSAAYVFLVVILGILGYGAALES